MATGEMINIIPMVAQNGRHQYRLGNRLKVLTTLDWSKSFGIRERSRAPATDDVRLETFLRVQPLK